MNIDNIAFNVSDDTDVLAPSWSSHEFVFWKRICIFRHFFYREFYIRELPHEMHLGNHRLVFASWKGMKTHYFYCHKPGNTKATCPILENSKLKTW